MFHGNDTAAQALHQHSRHRILQVRFTVDSSWGIYVGLMPCGFFVWFLQVSAPSAVALVNFHLLSCFQWLSL
jgi:hypothetical protein